MISLIKWWYLLQFSSRDEVKCRKVIAFVACSFFFTSLESLVCIHFWLNFASSTCPVSFFYRCLNFSVIDYMIYIAFNFLYSFNQYLNFSVINYMTHVASSFQEYFFSTCLINIWTFYTVNSVIHGVSKFQESLLIMDSVF